ncbi:hypothetical protein MRX96_042600 [Rhipicephalus microplus]
MCAALCSVIANSVGVGPVSFLLCTELLPPRRHGLLAGFSYSGVRTLFFLFRWSMRSDTYQVVYFAVAGFQACSAATLACGKPRPELRRAPGGAHELLDKQAIHEFPLRDFADTYKPPVFAEDTSTTTSTLE